MAQHDYDIANQTFPSFRSDLNNALQAILTNNSGATAPAVTAAGMIWVDTSSSPPTWRVRNAANTDWDLFASISAPPGTVNMYAGAAAPSGWLICNGGEVNRSTFAALFAVIGTTYGAGNGTTTFNLPNMTNRYPLGVGTQAIGAAGGSSTSGSTVLTEAQMPSHTHTGTTNFIGDHTHTYQLEDLSGTGTGGPGFSFNNRFVTGNTGAAGGHSHSFTTNGTGGSQGHDHSIAPPFLALNFIIKV